MFMAFHSGGIVGFLVVMFILYTLVKLSARASGYRGNSWRQNRRRGGMFGPGLWRDFNDPDNSHNPYSNNLPPSYNPYAQPPTDPNQYQNPNGGNNYYAPPGGFYQPGMPPSNDPNSFNWPQPTDPTATTQTTTTTSTSTPNAANTVRSWEMPATQAVLKEAYVWVRSMGGWNYAGKLIVEGGMSQAEVKRYAQGKFGVSDNDLVAIEAASLDDARRTFESYHLY